MPRKAGKRTAEIAALSGCLVLALTGWTFRDFLVEEWWFWKLDSGDPKTVMRAAHALAERGTSRAIPRLLAPPFWDPRLEGMPAWARGVPRVVTLCIERSGKRAAPYLVRFLESGHPSRDMVLWAAETVLALEPSDPVAIRVLIDALSDMERDRAFVALEKAGVDLVPALIDLVRSASWNSREWAASRLGEIGPQAASASPVLVGLALQSRDILGLKIARALAEMGCEDEVCVTICLEGIRSRSSALEATEALERMGKRCLKFLPRIIEVIAADPDPDVLNRAKKWEVWRDASDPAPFLCFLDDPRQSLRRFAIDVLHDLKTRDPTVLSRLRECLSDVDHYLACRAAGALAAAGAPDDQDRPAVVVATALENHPRETTLCAIEEVQYLGPRAPAVAPQLVRLLSTESRQVVPDDVRAAAERALLRIGAGRDAGATGELGSTACTPR